MGLLSRLNSRDDAYHEDEVRIGAADLLDTYLDPDAASGQFADIEYGRALTPSGLRLLALSQARMHIRRSQFDAAAHTLALYPKGRPAHLGIESALRVTRAYLAVAKGSSTAPRLSQDALQHAAAQRAHRWRRCAEVLCALGASSELLSQQIASIGSTSPQTLTFLADLVVPRLPSLSEPALAATAVAAHTHPDRWRWELRRAVDAGGDASIPAARILEEVGERSDIARLRLVARANRRRPDATMLGRRLSRRLASPLFVEDQGRVWLRIGERQVAGTAVRRKVLALICFLLSRPNMSSTRDQVLDTLWPDLDPDTAMNSLNQTTYFLRRVIEEDYVEDHSPGYIHHDSDVIWLDPELVTSRSIACRVLIKSFSSGPTPDEVDRLTELYRGRFALDFEYEEWASGYRDTLHASYLDIVERALREDVRSGYHERGIRVARRAMEVDPTATEIELTLLRLYRLVGAHAAAAEQYAHYASTVREEYGIEPPPLDSL